MKTYAQNFRLSLLKRVAFSLTAIAVAASSCNKNLPANPTSSVSPNMVLIWNDAATQAVTRAGAGPNGPLPPMPESYIYAQVNVAMHDALNNITPEYQTYALHGTADKTADPDAAVAKAAHDIIAELLPPLSAYADSLYIVSIKSIKEGDSRTRGIAIGQAAAAAMISKRSNDGYANAQTPYTPGTSPGDYQFTAPFNGPPFNGFAAVPAWGKITPFSIEAASQFRPGPPYAVNSAAYTADYNEVKGLGAATNSTRTAEQTQIGLFWVENCPLGWNRIARNIIKAKDLDAYKAAQLLAVLQMTEADGYISALEAKYYYNYWRPITAIQLGATDGNPNTAANPSFSVLAPPTPPIPDYPSAHAVNGAAAAQVLKDFFGDSYSFSATSTSLPNVTRSFTSFTQAARENSLSRIYVGYHFRNAVLKGEAQGYLIGDYVYNHALKRL